MNKTIEINGTWFVLNFMDKDNLNERKLLVKQIDNEGLLYYYSFQIIECESLKKIDNTFCKMVLKQRYEYLKMAKDEILERMGGTNNAK